jgi:diaminobutyrate-2-oxoglutarate transaminase
LVLTAAFNHGLLVETCGRGEIVKLMPPLTVTEAELAQALDILRLALAEVSGKRTSGRLTRNTP